MNIISIDKEIYQGEGKWFKFTATRNAANLPLTGMTFAFAIKDDEDAIDTIFVASTFDETQLALGVVRVNLPASITSTMIPKSYYGQLSITMTDDTDVYYSRIVKFKIARGIVPPPTP